MADQPSTRERNLTTARSQPVAGPFRNTDRSRVAIRWLTRPTWRANGSPRRMRVKITMAATSPASPASAASELPAPVSPWKASTASATTGVPSLTKLFQMPVTSTESVDRDFENPHDDSIE